MATVTEAGGAAVKPTNLRTVILASMVGTTIEWYDFFLYGTAAALVFNQAFFPRSEPWMGTLLAFVTYAVGFLGRPLGGLVFGHFGDRIGRKRLLMLSLFLMGGATVLIGCLPTYGQLDRIAGVGWVAPVLLVVLRLVQGFAVGGEWGGAVLLVAEHGDAKRRGFLTSFPQAGVAAGNLLASAVLVLMAATLSDQAFLDWGWRVPFVLSVVLIGVGWWIRSKVEESPAFAEIQREKKIHSAPALETLRTRPKALITGIGLRIAENLSYYIITAYSLSYVTQQVGLSRQTALNALMVGAGVQALAIPFFGWLSDKIGRRPVYAMGALGTGVWAFAFFRLLDTGATPAVMVAIVVGLVLHGAMYGSQAAFLAEMFPTRIRYSGASIASQFSSIVAGSLAPIVAIALFKKFESATPIAIYVAIAAAISFVSALLAKETRGKTFAEIDAEP